MKGYPYTLITLVITGVRSHRCIVALMMTLVTWPHDPLSRVKEKSFGLRLVLWGFRIRVQPFGLGASWSTSGCRCSFSGPGGG